MRDPGEFLQRRPHLKNQAGLSFQTGSMESFEFPRGEFRHVIHAATKHHESPSAIDLLSDFDHNVQGTRRVLEFARRCVVKQLLFTSSGVIYGRQPWDMTHMPEDYSGSCLSTDTGCGYGQAKRVSEYLCSLYSQAYGIETKIARCFAFVGPYLPLAERFAIGNFLRDALAGGSIIVQGDGTVCRSYLYTADLAVWLWTILFRGRSCRPYNVGSDQDLAIAQLARTVRDAVVPAAEVRVLQAADAFRPVARYVPDTKRAATELGLRVNIDLGDGIRRTAAWHKRPVLGAAKPS